MKSNHKFVKIPNQLLAGKTLNGATPKELRVYFKVKMLELKWYEGSIVTVDLLDNLMPSMLLAGNQKNKCEIREALNSLKERGFIHFEQNGSFAYTERLEISYEDPSKQFTMVDVGLFDYIKDNEHFAIMCLVLKNKGLDRPQFSYAEIADAIYLKSDRSIKDKLDEMEYQGLIRIEDGGLYQNEQGEWRRHMKSFEAIPFVEEEVEAQVAEKRTEESKPVDTIGENEGKKKNHENKEISIPERTGNWYKKNGNKYAKLKYKDFEIYMDTKELFPEFGLYCEGRISKLENAGFKFTEWKMQYKEELKKRESEEQDEFGDESDWITDDEQESE